MMRPVEVSWGLCSVLSLGLELTGAAIVWNEPSHPPTPNKDQTPTLKSLLIAFFMALPDLRGLESVSISIP